jgi:hypothetical protein
MRRLIDVRCASGAPTFCPNGVDVSTDSFGRQDGM